MQNNKNIYFSEYEFYPNICAAELTTEIVKFLQKNNFNLHVICSSCNPKLIKTLDKNSDPSLIGVKIKRVKPIYEKENSFIQRLINYIWFSINTFIFFYFAKKPLFFLIQTNPPINILIVSLVSLLRNIPFIVIAMDIYPEVFNIYYKKKIHPFVLKIVNFIFNKAFQKANKVISLGPYMTKRLVKKRIEYSKIFEISNWATGLEENEERELKNKEIIRNIENYFTILYTGNLGLVHDWETIIKCFQNYRYLSNNCRLIFIGKGSGFKNAKKYVKKNNLSKYIIFENLLPISEFNTLINSCSISLVSLKKGYEGLVVPSKLFGYLARKKPVIYIGPNSDVSHFIEKSKSGFCFRNMDYKNISECLIKLSNGEIDLKLIGNNGMKYYNQNLSKEIALMKYLKIAQHYTK